VKQVNEDETGTDIYFVPVGIILGIVILWATIIGRLGPASFWIPEGLGFFATVFAILVLPKKERRIADYVLLAMSGIGAVVWVFQMTRS
jgi:hypothetical protein